MKVITFEMGNQEFVIYSEREWNEQVQDWGKELTDDGFDISDWEEEDVIEAMWGDEFFYEKVESL